MDECFACMVGVATGPESHDSRCSARNIAMPEQDAGRQAWHEYDVHVRRHEQRQWHEFVAASEVACSCVPCTSPGYGAPGYDHCAAGCAGTLIEEYDPRCLDAGHREMARRQFPGPR